MNQQYKFFTCIFFFFSITICAFATTRTAIANSGNGWSNASNWNPSGVPQNGDTVIIPAAFTFTVKGNIYSSPLPHIHIIIHGNLDFDPSGKLELGVNSFIQVSLGGSITSNNTASEIISINGVIKFSGQLDGAIAGPAFANSSTGTSPSGFTPGVPLPVKIIAFTAVKYTQHLELKWITAEEINFEKFIVEKSTDNRQWSAIATITARGGLNVNTSYSATDYSPSDSLNLYRLKSVDQDGRFEYSQILKVMFTNESLFDVTISPNPATSYLNISIKNGKLNDYILVRLMSQQGQLVKAARYPVSVNAISFDVSDVIKGTYLAVVSDKSKRLFSSMLIIR